jgi:hypothetical protein
VVSTCMPMSTAASSEKCDETGAARTMTRACIMAARSSIGEECSRKEVSMPSRRSRATKSEPATIGERRGEQPAVLLGAHHGAQWHLSGV